MCGGVCAVCLVSYAVVSANASETNRFHEVHIDQIKLYPVSSVIDGDTFKARVDNRQITVRMLGINTPETVDPRKPPQCFGPEASEETKSLLMGHSVRLAFNPNREARDRYGRYLLYVHRDDGLFVNEYLVKGGFAREYTVGKPYSMQAEFRKAESEAKATKDGLWGTCV